MDSRCNDCGKLIPNGDFSDHQCDRRVICSVCGADQSWFSQTCWYCNSENLEIQYYDEDKEEKKEEKK